MSRFTDLFLPKEEPKEEVVEQVPTPVEKVSETPVKENTSESTDKKKKFYGSFKRKK